MHDWTLISLEVQWMEGTVNASFADNSSNVVLLIAKDFTDLKLPRHSAWGESVSVNEVDGPKKINDERFYLGILMQSGDKIEIEAKEFLMPASSN